MRGASWHTLSPELVLGENQAAKPNWEQGGALLEMEREVLGWWGASWCLVGQWGTSQGTLGARLGTG